MRSDGQGISMPAYAREKWPEAHLPVDCQHRRVDVGVAGAQEAGFRVGLEQGSGIGGLEPAAKALVAMVWPDACVALPDERGALRGPGEARESDKFTTLRMASDRHQPSAAVCK